MANTEGENFQSELRQDAAEMGAYEFAQKHGKINLRLYDKIRDDIDKCVGAYHHLKFIVKQARKYVYDSPNLDYNSDDVKNWRALFIEEIDRVLNIGPIELNATYEEDDNEQQVDDNEWLYFK